jgi:ketosteroid isomerase-like protein
MSTDDEVREASKRFYAALNAMLNGDAGSLADIWSHSATVTTMHPVGGRQVGWDEVRASWEQIARLASAGQVVMDDQIIRVAGDAAYELGVERGHVKIAGQEVQAIEDRVTNIYLREAGQWKIVHHHTDISQAMLDAVSRVQAKT